MPHLLLSLTVYLAAVAETSLLDLVRVGSVAPDLLALVAIIWLLTAAGPRGFLTAGGVALVGDLIAPGRLGLGMAAMLLVGYAITRLRARLPIDHLAWQVLAVWLAVTVWAMSVAIAARLLGEVSLPWSTLAARTAGTGFFTAAVSLPVLMVHGWLHEKKGSGVFFPE